MGEGRENARRPAVRYAGMLTARMAGAIQNRWFWRAVLVRLLSGRSLLRGRKLGIYMGSDVSAGRHHGSAVLSGARSGMIRRAGPDLAALGRAARHLPGSRRARGCGRVRCEIRGRDAGRRWAPLTVSSDHDWTRGAARATGCAAAGNGGDTG